MRKMLTLLLVSFLFYQCGGDPCEDVVCINNGVCFEGECECPTGYTGAACQNLICQNGGIDVGGVCNCPTGFGGTFCQNALVPSSVIINAIAVTSFPPAQSNGGGWDVNDGPDLYVAIARGGVRLLTTEFHANCVNGFTYEFPNELPLVLTSPTLTHEIGLFDFDSLNDDDFLGGFSFSPFSQNVGTINPVVLELPSSAVRFVLDVDYGF